MYGRKWAGGSFDILLADICFWFDEESMGVIDVDVDVDAASLLTYPPTLIVLP